MADVMHRGFFEALLAGDLAGTPDLRALLSMGGFTAEPDAQTLSGFADLDEFDGVGYGRRALTSVSIAWDAVNHRPKLDFGDIDFGGGGDVAPGSGVITSLTAYLYVDGTAANDVPLLTTTSGGFGVNASNSPLVYVVAAGGFAVMRLAD
jgi:hypothetical protein